MRACDHPAVRAQLLAVVVNAVSGGGAACEPHSRELFHVLLQLRSAEAGGLGEGEGGGGTGGAGVTGGGGGVLTAGGGGTGAAREGGGGGRGGERGASSAAETTSGPAMAIAQLASACGFADVGELFGRESSRPLKPV